MSVVTATELDTAYGKMTISYFDGRDQLVPFKGYFVEGHAPYVPEDDAPGWVIFEMTEGTFQEQSTELARKLFCDLGFTSDQVITLMGDF